MGWGGENTPLSFFIIPYYACFDFNEITDFSQNILSQLFFKKKISVIPGGPRGHFQIRILPKFDILKLLC